MHFQNCSLKKVHSQNCSLQKRLFWNCSLKRGILIFNFNLFFIKITRKTFKVINNMSNFFFFHCIYTLLKTLADNSLHLFFKAECKLITAKEVWLKPTLWISLSWKSSYFLISPLTLSQIKFYFSNKSSSSIKKYIHLVWPSQRFTYALVSRSIICKSLFYNHHTINQ